MPLPIFLLLAEHVDCPPYMCLPTVKYEPLLVCAPTGRRGLSCGRRNWATSSLFTTTATAEVELRFPGEQRNLPWIWGLLVRLDRWRCWVAELLDWQPLDCCKRPGPWSRFTRKICHRTPPRILPEVIGFRLSLRNLKSGQLSSIDNSRPRRSLPTDVTRLWLDRSTVFAGSAAITLTTSLGT